MIPDKPVPQAPPEPPEFVRNVVGKHAKCMRYIPVNYFCYLGSSAGAGSAEFHIYRNNRKKETLRLEWLDKEAKRKELDSEYERRRAEREREIEERTNKKRSKRFALSCLHVLLLLLVHYCSQKQKEKMKKRRLEEKAQKASRRSESQSQNDSSDTTSDEDSCDEGDKPAVSGSRITPTTSDDQTAVPPSLTAT